jgi:hypothetical protein
MPNDMKPEIPAELWMLWTARKRWLADSAIGAMAYLVCFSEAEAKLAASEAKLNFDIECTPVRVDRPAVHELTTGIIAPPLFELPDGSSIDPAEVSMIEFAESEPTWNFEPRVILEWRLGQKRKIIQRFPTNEQAQAAARDLGRRINQARRGS